MNNRLFTTSGIKTAGIITLLIIITISCRKEENKIIPSSDIHLIGTWDIEKMASEINGKTETLIKEQLDSLGTVWMYTFKSDNTIEQITDYDSTFIKMPGTWSAGGGKLTMRLIIPNGKEGIFVYYYEVNGNKLLLYWEEHTGAIYHAHFNRL